jgi:hypothetical protein
MTVTHNVTFSIVPTSLPSYLAGKATLASGTGEWASVAASGALAVMPSPKPGIGFYPYGGTPWAYSGATVDQDRKELLVVGSGGHTDYGGNESYALRLSANTPAWERLTESSTDAVMAQRNMPDEYNGTMVPLGEPFRNTDGIPHSCHNGCEQQWLNGRVWFTSQTAIATEPQSIAAVYSFDRASVGNPSVPLSQSTTPTNSAPWRFHGNWKGTNNAINGFGYSAIDSHPSRMRVWGVEASNDGFLWSLKTATGLNETTGRLNSYSIAHHYPAMWACCAPDLGILVIGRGSYPAAGITTPTVSVFDISGASPVRLSDRLVNMTDTNGLSVYYDEVGIGPAPNDFANNPNFCPTYNAVYHEASKSILLFEGRRKPSGKIVQIRIPNSGGAYTAANNWTVTLRPTTGGNFTGLGDSMNGRFNMVNDIGNGESVLVAAPRFNGATYVCRIGSLT